MQTTDSTFVLSIAKEFSRTPGPRYVKEGPFSGELFRTQKLKDAFLRARDSKQKLMIDLDGGYGYATSFLEEAFGGLAGEFGSEIVNSTLEFKSDEEPSLVKNIRQYILDRKPNP